MGHASAAGCRYRFGLGESSATASLRHQASTECCVSSPSAGGGSNVATPRVIREDETVAVASRPVALDRLTSLRAFAAFAVFGLHVGRAHLLQTGAWTGGGYVAVSFFFVLSGFVLVWSSPSSVTAKRFYRRRFARLYPAHIVMLAVALVAAGTLTGTGLVGVLLGGLLLQAWATSSSVVFSGNAVAWSLSCEAFFYALFPALLAAMRRARQRTLLISVTGLYAAAATLAIVGVAVSGMTANNDLNNLVYTDPLIRLPEFLLGMAAGVAFCDGWRPAINMRAAVLALLGLYVLLTPVLDVPGPLLDTVTPLLFVGIVLGAANRDMARRPGWLTHPALIYAGQASFCFYLVQLLVVTRAREILGTGGLAAGASFLAAVAGAVILRHAVELPMQRRLRPSQHAPIPTETDLPSIARNLTRLSLTAPRPPAAREPRSENLRRVPPTSATEVGRL